MDDGSPRMVTCKACNSERVKPILDFGVTPLANRYLTKSQILEPELKLPLAVTLCLKCGCVQLAHNADPKLLFEEYYYTSSTSGSLASHFEKYAITTVSKLKLFPDKDFIVGIGGNDGPLESAYQRLGFDVLNVEASSNISELSRSNGVPTVNEWFTEAVASRIVENHGQASLITCNNCFAHIPDIHEVIRAIKLLLKPGAWFVCENAYWLSAVQGYHFDQIYHEHCFYWTVKALEKLFKQHGMSVMDVEFNQSQGGSIRMFVQNVSRPSPPKITDLIHKEEDAGLFRVSTYVKWKRNIGKWRQKCLHFLALMKSVACYGVPAKFTMISEQLGFDPFKIQYAVEDSPIKIGKFTPGSHIPIVAKQYFIEHPTEHCIITASNYADLIVKSNPQYRGKWIVLTPEPRTL